VAVADNFEGLPKRANFTEFDWTLIRNSQKVAGIKSLDKFARRLFMSRLLERPMALMKEKVESLIAGIETRDSIRFFMTSAHDT